MAFVQKGNLNTHIRRQHHAEMRESMKGPVSLIQSSFTCTITETTDTITTETPGNKSIITRSDIGPATIEEIEETKDLNVNADDIDLNEFLMN